MAEIDLTQQRIAESHARFRRANKHIEAAAHTLDVVGAVPFICECADPECMETVRLDREEYGDVREHPRRFFTAPGHAAETVEAGLGIIVSDSPGHTLADGIGLEGAIAEERHDAHLP
jgi:hypothetical protein